MDSSNSRPRLIAAGLIALATATLAAAPVNAAEPTVAVLEGKALTRSQLVQLKHQHQVHLAFRPHKLARVFLDERAFRRFLGRTYGVQPASQSMARAAASGGSSTLYEHINNGGYSMNVAANTGRIDLSRERFCNWWGGYCKTVNDRISSVDDQSSGGTELWEHANYQGSSVYVPPRWRVNLTDWDFNFNDAASSVKVYA